jgi:predicted metal-dependent peptidase
MVSTPSSSGDRHGRELRTKLSAARTRLILEHPFIGALVMHLPLAEASSRQCPTIATDARAVYFNPDYIARLTFAETQFVLAHEALHCALAHFARRAHRVRKRWDAACDHAVNLILIQEGMRPPLGVLANRDFLGLTAEEIYPLIPAETSELPLDGHFFDGMPDGAGDSGRPLRTEEAVRTRDLPSGDAPRDPLGSGQRTLVSGEALAQCWQGRLTSAAQAAMEAGRLSDSVARALRQLVQPRLPWRALLSQFLVSVARDDYSFQRRSRREGDTMLPRLASGEINLAVALDTSGSIGEEEMQAFASEVDALKGQVRANLVLLACDDKLSVDGPWRFAPWEPMTLPRSLSGGGGTRFGPVFEWIEGEALRPDLLLYFTDGQGEFPAVAPPYPVVWLVKGRAQVPWGERIQLD